MAAEPLADHLDRRHRPRIVHAGGAEHSDSADVLALDNDEAMIATLAQVVARQLTVRQTEELVKQLLTASAQPDEAPAQPAPSRAADSQLTHMENRFRAVLGTRVNLSRNRDGAGRLIVHFYSDEELSQLFQVIAGDDEL